MTITPATSMPESLNSFIDAASDTIARAVASIHKDAVRERELRDAQFAARMAELETRIASVSELERRLADRLTALKDGEPGRDGADGAAGAAGERGEQGETGPAGKDAAPEIVAGIVQERMQADLEAIRAELLDQVKDAVAAIPAPQDGHSPSPEEIAPLIDESVRNAVAALPVPQNGKDGVDGTSISLEDVAPVIEEAVQRAVSTIPVPKDGTDGRDGKDVDPEALAEMVRAEVAALPPAEPGKDADPELVASLVDEKVRAAVAALPPAEKGEKGDRGDAGPVGALPVVKAWEDRVYYEGEVVSRDGSIFQARRDTGKAPDHEDWVCLVDRGRDGVDGRSFSVRGTYVETEEYRALDVVALNGASFAARRDNPGQCPGEGWQLIAGQGKQGKPGPKGDPGTGLRGEPGQPVVDMHIDENGMVTVVNGDGSTVECDFYPLLSRIG